MQKEREQSAGSPSILAQARNTSVDWDRAEDGALRPMPQRPLFALTIFEST